MRIKIDEFLDKYSQNTNFKQMMPFNQFLAVLGNIGNYNTFDPEEIKALMLKFKNLFSCKGHSPSNLYKCLKFGREGSPVIYLGFYNEELLEGFRNLEHPPDLIEPTQEGLRLW